MIILNHCGNCKVLTMQEKIADNNYSSCKQCGAINEIVPDFYTRERVAYILLSLFFVIAFLTIIIIHSLI